MKMFFSFFSIINNLINSSTCLENEDEEGKKKNRKIMKHLPCQTQSDTVLAFSKSCSYSGATPNTVSCYTPLIKDSVSCPTDQIKTNEITKEKFDSWTTDLLSNKMPDKSAVVKQGVQTLNLVSKNLSETENISIFFLCQ